jgi:integrase
MLPKERAKNNRAHVVPLSPQAMAVLDDCPAIAGREFVFGVGKGGFNGFAPCKRTLNEATGLSAWVVHDLRRTVATRMSDLGVAPHVVEAVLNHVSGFRAGVAGVYNKSSYSAEKRAALDLWGNHIRILLAQANGANITKLKRA